MLIEFRINGFMAFTSEQVLRLSRNRGNENPEMYFEAGGTTFLRTVAIYGTNGSGKSTIVTALSLMRALVLRSGLDSTKEILEQISGYARDTASFAVEFMANDVRYRYGFSVKNKLITNEWLQASPQGRTQRLFERVFNADSQTSTYTYFGRLQGEKKHWERATKNDTLYLGTAIVAGSSQLAPVKKWFAELGVVSDTTGPEFTGDFYLREKNAGVLILNFLKALNIGITNLKIGDRAIGGNNDFTCDIPLEALDITLTHENPDGTTYELPLKCESAGTKRLVALAGPIVYAYYTGQVICIDDLDLHLHQKVFSFLASLFNDTTSGHNGQLIFTAHNTSILNQERFRRDEIWFCEKSPENVCSLRPLTDFKPRKDSDDIEQNYLTGKYDIVPYVINL